ncbi:hypothetical protein [Psychrobacter aestuarii]|uniref:Lipoprotein n=1 Tax=Psychrobacter aestuarii TaxID=556327 RepID=A0ABN0VX05_9GAMM|nr:hypothetical protein [Psychrobacter aestuarii]
MMTKIFSTWAAVLITLSLSGCQSIQFVDSPIPVTTLQPQGHKTTAP